VHFNVRRIETARGWFGGGTDLTPTIPFEEDNTHFHSVLEKLCEQNRPGSHREYKEWCDRYFFLPHRGEARGAGGIFFDNLDSGDAEADFRFVQDVGRGFLHAYIPLVARRKATPFTDADKQKQLVKRGRYAEFNLLYDRGTRFGLMTGGNPEAILMSLPPTAKWG
jgi:coproporphyrinogen III oxidase